MFIYYQTLITENRNDLKKKKKKYKNELKIKINLTERYKKKVIKNV